jgi:lipopolysaccharide biosynthesis glycosyltransferase
MAALVHHLDTSPTVADAQFPDQDVLAEVFRGKWRVLPWWTNALKTERAVHKNIWDDSEVRLLHYILDKPWEKRPARAARVEAAQSGEDMNTLPRALIQAVHAAPPQESMTDYDEVHSWWWRVYDQLLAEIKAEGGSDWEAVNKWVAHD